MATRKEGYFTGCNDSELFFQSWECDNPRGTIVVTHGLAEHSDCYNDFADILTEFQWNVYAWDLRGHGRSHGKRGCVENFSFFERDLATFLDLVAKQSKHCRGPLVAFGHSMGGLITTKTLLKALETPVTAVALSSPEFGLRIKVPWYKQKAAEVSNKWLPNITMWNEISYSDLTRDEEMIKKYSKDPLRHDKISPALFLGMTESFEVVRQGSKNWSLPLLMQVGGNDQIVDPQSCIEFFEGVESENKEIHIYSDSLHEIYNDLDKDRVYHDLKTFLNQFQL